MRKIAGVLIALLLLSLTACGGEPKHTVTVEKQEFDTIEDFNVVCVYTEYTNNSGESALPADWVSVKAYQNGIELSPLVFTGSKTNGYIQCDTSVQDGTTAKVVWIFQRDDDSEVSVEVSDL